MPSEPVLDVPALLAPIPGDDPAGGPTPFDVRQKLDEGRKEVDPSTFAADDPMRPTEFQHADWSGIVKIAKDSLTTKSKDLLVGARLTEALVKVHGFAGLRDGLKLLTGMLTECWDRLNPKVDDPSDLDMRAGPFEWLDDADRGGRFPSTIRQVPLVAGEETKFSWVDWKRGQETQDRAAAELFEKAVAAASPEHCYGLAEDLDAAREALDALTAALTEKLAAVAPGMLQLRRAIDDCRALVGMIVQRKPKPGADTESPETPPADAGTTASSATPAPTLGRSRDALYRQITEIAAQLERLEPHSPVPYLLRRAATLGAMPFPDMIRSFVRDENVIQEMIRELDITSK